MMIIIKRNKIFKQNTFVVTILGFCYLNGLVKSCVHGSRKVLHFARPFLHDSICVFICRLYAMAQSANRNWSGTSWYTISNSFITMAINSTVISNLPVSPRISPESMDSYLPPLYVLHTNRSSVRVTWCSQFRCFWSPSSHPLHGTGLTKARAYIPERIHYFPSFYRANLCSEYEDQILCVTRRSNLRLHFLTITSYIYQDLRTSAFFLLFHI